MNTEIERRLGFETYPISFTTKVRKYDLGETLIPKDTILLAFRGSVAHGMFVDPEDVNGIDDVDLIGITIPSQRYYLGLSQWGSRGTKEYRNGIWDGVYYEIKKLVSMLLEGNPNVLSLLWVKPEHRLFVSPVGEMLYEFRNLFVGKHVFNAFAGYANAQLLKMTSRDPSELREYLAVTAELKYRGAHPNHKGEVFPRPYELPFGDLDQAIDSGDHECMVAANESTIRRLGSNEAVNVYNTSTEKLMARLRHYQKKGENIGYMGEKRKRMVVELGYDSKNASHCIRLLRMCSQFLQTGSMTVYRPDAGDDQELLRIKRGEWTLERVKEHAEHLFQQARDARDHSPLPDEPDRERVEYKLIQMISSHWLR